MRPYTRFTTVSAAGRRAALSRAATAARALRLPVLLVVVVSLCISSASVAGVTDTFREANALYESERYGEAADLYESIVESGFRSADVQYNLGNARYRSGDLGRAVLAYERALRIEPGHEDAAANLAFVQELLADRRTPVGGALTEFFGRLDERLTSDRLALVACAFYFILFGVLTLRVLRGGLSPWLARIAGVAAIALVFFGGVLVYRVAQERSHVQAVVMPDEVGVRTGPGDDFLMEFRLHEGTKVVVEERRGEWARVMLRGTDLEGWLPGEAVEEI